MDENQEPETLPNWRYVIYARKSTEDAEKQVRSIDDQVSDCEKLANEFQPQGLHVIDTIKETKSAKIPGKRKLFNQLMKDVRAGKVDGIIAWHPDRLARNMVEAGRIIHMLDKGTLKDLRFKSHQFSNDANGKMLLGMLFVFAKHYSDDLSLKVSRGVTKNFAEGKSGGQPKHGYIRNDDTGSYNPDRGGAVDNFKLVQQAWHMRADGVTEDDCAKYLKDNGYTKYSKKLKEYQEPKLGNSIMGRMFGDTFYFGLLNQAGGTSDLRTTPGSSFIPMIDEDIFYRVQEHSKANTRGAGKKRPVFLPLRRMVYCGVCNYSKYMGVGRIRDKNGVHRLYYTCKNKDCSRKYRNMKAKRLFDSLAEIIEARIASIPLGAYEAYVKDVKAASGSQKLRTREELSSMQLVLRRYNDKMSSLTVSLGKLSDERAIKALNRQISDLSSVDIGELEYKIDKHKRRLQKSELPALPPEVFEQRIKRAALKFNKGDKFQKDIIIRDMFMKLYVDDEKVVTYLWKEPYLSLVEATDISLGRGDRD